MKKYKEIKCHYRMEDYLNVYSCYTNEEMGHMRPVNIQKGYQEKKLKENYTDICKYCDFYECKCENRIRCDKCMESVPLTHLIFDIGTSKSTCVFCAGEADKKQLVELDILYRQLREDSLYFLHQCTSCSTKYLVGKREYFKSNVKERKEMLSWCINCVRDMKRCSNCGDLSAECKECHNGDCVLCHLCRLECGHCPRTKKCTEPFPGKNVCCKSENFCLKCLDYPSFSCNSYGQIVQPKNCPHAWCRVCELCNPSHKCP